MAQAAQQQPIYCQIGSAQSQQGGYYCQIGAPTGDHYGPLCAQQTNNSDRTDREDEHNDEALREHEQNVLLSRMLSSKGSLQAHLDEFFKTILSVRAPASAYATSGRTTAAGRLIKKSQPVYELRLDEPFQCAPNASPVQFCSQTMQMSHQNRLQRQNAPTNEFASCPKAIKWLFDLLDEAARKHNVADADIVHSWKSNAFLLRFWVNFIKNPNYVLDVEKSTTIDASLSTVAQTLMESCAPAPRTSSDLTAPRANKETTNPLFAKDIPKYRNLVGRFYEDIASLRPVSDREIAETLGSLSAINAGKFDTSLALRELCVYAINYGSELMQALNSDPNCQQLNLPNLLEQCFRSFTIFEAYR